MSISAINNGVTAPPPPQQFQQVRNDFQSLQQALSQGDLTAAQQAYSAIQTDQGGRQPPANSPLANDFNAIGQALQSGDLTGAQKAFASLQSDFQSVRASRGGGRHRGGGHGGGGSDDGDDSSSSNASKTVTNEVTATNADGTQTVTTTYSDGSTSTQTQPNPNPTVSQNPLAANGGQLSVLLTAQEQQALKG